MIQNVSGRQVLRFVSSC